MTWGPYYFFYNCPNCGKKYRWSIDEMDYREFSHCPNCQTPGELVGETKDINQQADIFADYDYI